MQPDPLEIMKVPEGINPENVIEQATVVRPLSKRWKNGIMFKEFHTNTLKRY